jgi:RNA polymerase sigma-70 factor, ECF subfamily
MDNSGAEAERAWLRGIVQQRRDDFRALFERYAPRVKGYLQQRGMTGAIADEIVQEVMLTVWRRATTFDPRRAAVSTWIFAITRNRLIDRQRHEQRPEFDANDPFFVPAQDDAEPEAAADVTRALVALRGAFETLPAEQARVLSAAYAEGKSFSTIAAIEQLPLSTVKTRARLALERLRRVVGVKDTA